MNSPPVERRSCTRHCATRTRMFASISCTACSTPWMDRAAKLHRQAGMLSIGQVTSSSNPTLRSVAVRLATIFGDKKAIAKLRQTALDKAGTGQ